MADSRRHGRLAGKVVLVSGTGSGLGRASARIFAAEGATVVGCDINLAGADETVALLESEGRKMLSLAPVDVSDRAGATAWIEYAVSEFGGFDILCNNAGRVRNAPFPELTDEDYAFTMRNELDVVWYCCQAAWPHLADRGGGAILNVSSIAGLIGAPARPMAAHAAAKGAVIALTRQLAAEGGSVGIRVNCISPGSIDTPTARRLLDELGESAPFYPLVRATASERLGDLEDVVYAAVYLASDESTWVTGANFVVDGGATVFVK